MIVELTKLVKVIRPEARSAFPYSNSLYIDDEVKTMIDAGAGGNAYQAISPQDVNLVLISHNHFDHVNGLSFFENARIFAGYEEASTYTDPQAYFRMTGFHRWEELMGERKAGNLNSLLQMPDDVPSQLGFCPVPLSGVFKDGDTFNLGETCLKVIHTPGHALGHYSFYIQKEGILFSGDIDISPRGPWYGDESSDLDQLIDSVNRLQAIDPRILVTSHRHIFYENIAQELQGFIDIALERENSILEFLAEPRTLNEIAACDFAFQDEHRNIYAVFWARMMIIKHLKRLARLHKIEKIEIDEYVKYRRI